MSDDKTPLHRYLGIGLHPRSAKPRKQGITMVIDTGYNCAMVESVLALYGHIIDIVKLTELHLTAPLSEIKRKVALYKAAGVGVQPGGIVIELARLQHKEAETLDRLAASTISRSPPPPPRSASRKRNRPSSAMSLAAASRRSARSARNSRKATRPADPIPSSTSRRRWRSSSRCSPPARRRRIGKATCCAA
jgi:hypothetical protein